ncbi:sensor domain-containing diguanylate cyclase [Notoacmeibacter ruber]|uniref:Diguanylate cyclase n=1 Tax=Notoacmeibacter ruber TaxID=2670375 RepID=A0A3L7JI90_9HYPH|nr:diguanylate cyclase [Notoacmeibacter ruber]
MWIEDFSGVKLLFDHWRSEGVEDLRAWLKEDVSRVIECSSAIRVLRVNRRTLELFEAENHEDLVANLDRVFRDDMLTTHIEELAQLFEGKREFSSNAVNYTLTGRRLDIQLRGSIMPGHEETMDRLLLTTEDVTEREAARRREEEQRRYAEGIFEHSPVSLWVEDFSGIKMLLDGVRERGITDFCVFTDVHPEFVRQCMSEIRVLAVNNATLELFGAPDRQSLLQNQQEIFRGDMEKHFREQLVELWNGNLVHSREVLNYALDGTERHVLLQLAVLPGHENDWNLVQVSLTDITARKKAEAYLEYLGKHDVLTRLHNRAFYTEELNRLDRKPLRPVAAIIIDLNGLKETNDSLGHEAGDGVLRRLGEVLNEAVVAPNCAARIGGDEFAILMPGGDWMKVATMTENIEKLLKINNKFYSSTPISISIGAAVSEEGDSMEAVVGRADLLMYARKQEYYASKRKKDLGNSSAA